MTTTKEETTGQLISWLSEFIQDWGLDETITPQTKFNEDLCFSSVDMLHFLAVVDMNTAKKHPFEKLILADGVYRNELTVEELSDFVYASRDLVSQEPKAL